MNPPWWQSLAVLLTVTLALGLRFIPKLRGYLTFAKPRGRQIVYGAAVASVIWLGWIAEGMGLWVYERLKAVPSDTRISMWNRYIAGAEFKPFFESYDRYSVYLGVKLK